MGSSVGPRNAAKGDTSSHKSSPDDNNKSDTKAFKEIATTKSRGASPTSDTAYNNKSTLPPRLPPRLPSSDGGAMAKAAGRTPNPSVFSDVDTQETLAATSSKAQATSTKEQPIKPKDRDGIYNLPGPRYFKLCSKTNIINLPVDVVVNAANSKLEAGGGVCGAIFDAAGKKQLQKACSKIEAKSSDKMLHRHRGKEKCPPGEVAVTNACKLKERNGASYIFHTVGINLNDRSLSNNYQPVHCTETLAECYTNVVNKMVDININDSDDSDGAINSRPLANDITIKTAAVPIIGGGIYSSSSSLITKETIIDTIVKAIYSNKKTLEKHGMTIVLCCHKQQERELVEKSMAKLGILE